MAKEILKAEHYVLSKAIKDKKLVSAYQPDDYTKERLLEIWRDYDLGHTLMNKPYRELNDRSPITTLNEDHKIFNSYVPPRSSDPDKSWRAQTVRPITRAKLVSIAGHVVAATIIPEVFAQNEDDEEDRDGALVMRDLKEWVIDNSNYSQSFLYGVIQALYSPACILESKVVEHFKLVRKRLNDGTIEVKEALDEVLSGFNVGVVPIDELYIANPYESNIQKQRFLVRTRRIDWHEAKGVYGHMEGFQFVEPGLRNVIAKEEGTFYMQYDKELEGLVEEVTYYNRSADLQITVLNGVMVTSPDEPNPRLDKKYPFAKSGYEPVDEGRFFYYKSSASKLANDQKTVDTLYNMIIDGTFLSLMPPVAYYGEEELDSGVLRPSTVVSLGPDERLEQFGPRPNLRAGMDVAGMVERSISETSQDHFRQGVMQGAPGRTAFEFSTLEKNAQIALGLFGKMIGFLVLDLGNLMVSDIIQHLTVADADKILSENGRLRFRRFVLSDKIEDGRNVPHEIEFDIDAGTDPLAESFELLKRNGGMKPKKKIFRVNPEKFAQLRFHLKVKPDVLEIRSKALQRALNLEAYDRAIQNPTVDVEAVTRDFLLESYKPGESDKYMRDEQEMQQEEGRQMPRQQGVGQNITGQLTGSNSLMNTLSFGE